MRLPKKLSGWQGVFALCCLIYLPWMISLGRNNFDMVHSQYRQAGARLEPAHIAAAALEELATRCRLEAKRRGVFFRAGSDDPCLAVPPEILKAQQAVVRARLGHQRDLALRKLVLFYISFGLFFLFLPPALLYLLLVFCSWFFLNIKVVK